VQSIVVPSGKRAPILPIIPRIRKILDREARPAWIPPSDWFNCRAGGKAFCAPIKTIPDLEKLEEIVRELQLYGLDGLEAIYDEFSEEQRSQLCDIADRHHLLFSAGDIHSNNGVFAIDFPYLLEKFREAVISSMTISNESQSFLQTQPCPPPHQSLLRDRISFANVLYHRIFLPTLIAIGLFLAAIWEFFSFIRTNLN
jgi:hypothetical protein